MAPAETPLEQIATKWWIPALIGVLSVAAGILALAYEEATLLALGLIFGIFILLFGTFALLAAFEPGAPTSVLGLIGIAAGIIVLADTRHRAEDARDPRRDPVHHPRRVRDSARLGAAPHPQGVIGPHRIQSLHEAVRAGRIMALAHGTAGAIAAR